MSLNEQQVREIARLAHIEIDDSEIKYLQKELSDVLELIEQLRAVDTTHVKPMEHAHEQGQHLRDDKVQEPDRRDVFLALAPETEEGLFLVPKVIE